MGGMCFGSYLLPRYVSAEHHPLKVYAYLESGIGLMGLLLLFGMPLVNSVYIWIGGGHIAVRAIGKAAVEAAHAAGLAHGGSDAGSPGPRPQYGGRCFAAYLRDPDGLRVELVSGGRSQDG